MKFTGVKDLDRKILNQLSDKDLLAICSSNKKWRRFCDTDQILWMNRIYNKFPNLSSDIINKYKTWFVDFNNNPWFLYYMDLKSVNETNAQSVLIYASDTERMDLLMIAIEKGADINSSYEDSYMQISYAIESEWLDGVKYFIENGSYIDLDELDLAATYGYLDIIKYFNDIGIDIHERDDWILVTSASAGQIDLVKYLMKNGANKRHDEALRESVKSNNIDIVKYIINNGVIDNKQIIITKAIQEATENNYTEIVNYLKSL